MRTQLRARAHRVLDDDTSTLETGFYYLGVILGHIGFGFHDTQLLALCCFYYLCHFVTFVVYMYILLL